VLILKEGTKIEVDRLKKYKDKSVDYVWVKKIDFIKFSRKTAAIAGVLISSDKLDTRKKSQVLALATGSVFKQLEHIGLSIDTYELAKQVSEATVALCQNHRELSVLLDSLKNCGDEFLRHSIAVSVLSTLIGEAMGWTNRVTLEKLALGGMLHDIGLKTLPHELVKKPLVSMTNDETELYETHSYRGVQLLQSVGVIPDDVIAIVYEHHENGIGQGHPRRLRDIVMHPMAKVVALANHFVELTIPHMNTPYPKTPREALVFIQETLAQPYNKDAFKALTKIVDKESSKKAS
jgi:putative nucleotidyltransferase with HDIG domain